MKKLIISMLSGLILLSSAFAVDLSLRVEPFLLFPPKKDVFENYKTAYYGMVQADADLFGFLTVGLEGFGSINPIKLNSDGSASNLISYGWGASVGGYYYPLSRLYLSAGGSFGLAQYNITYTKRDETSPAPEYESNFYWRAFGEVGFRVSPEFTISGIGGYASFLANQKSTMQKGPFAGISAKITIPVGNNKNGGIAISLDQTEPAFPLYMTAYRTCPVANVTINNTEGAEIKDVHVSFRAGRYTDSAYESAVIPVIKKYGSVDIPLYAAFSQEILKFSENGKISGEVIVDYNLLGKKRQAIQNVVIDVYNRNAYVWADSSSLAAFVSSGTDEIKNFTGKVVGVARNDYRTGINRNLENTIAIMESLRASQVEVKEDVSSPYAVYHTSFDVDSVQYPLQTMNMLGGDCDEVGILMASCLETIKVPTGFILTDDDFILLVDMEIGPKAAGNHFASTKGLVITDDTVYFGLSMKNFNQGFMKSYSEAAKTIAKLLANPDAEYEFVDIRSAWTYYEPAVFTGSSGLFTNPTDSIISKTYGSMLNKYVEQEINGVVDVARKSGDPNKYGLALVRIGRYDEAIKEFSKSDSISAMNNLANVYFTQGKYDAAIKQWQKVLDKEPGNQTAEKGIYKAQAKLKK